MAKLNAEDLPEEVQERLGIKEREKLQPPRVSMRLIVLGAILVELKGLSVRDAMWTLRKAGDLIHRQRDNEKAIRERGKKREQSRSETSGEG